MHSLPRRNLVHAWLYLLHGLRAWILFGGGRARLRGLPQWLLRHKSTFRLLHALQRQLLPAHSRRDKLGLVPRVRPGHLAVW